MKPIHSLPWLGYVVVAFPVLAETLEATTYHGAPAFRLSDGQTEAFVVPSLSGRVMRFAAVGGENWLWNAPPQTLIGDGYKNWGGDKTFVGPHSVWNTFAPKLWPPQPSWDGPAHRAQMLPGNRLQTVGNVWQGFGVRVVREFWFNQASEFVVSQRLEKVSGEARLLSIWQVAQIAKPDAVFLPLSPRSAYPNGFHAFGTLPASAKVEIVAPAPSPATNRRNGMLKITPTTGKSYKLGSDAPVASIAAVKGGMALVLRADKPQGSYPDGAEGAGFPVEFYNHGADGAGQYNEIELLSPMRRFAGGTAWTHSVRWSLHALPPSEAASLERLGALLFERPNN